MFAVRFLFSNAFKLTALHPNIKYRSYDHARFSYQLNVQIFFKKILVKTKLRITRLAYQWFFKFYFVFLNDCPLVPCSFIEKCLQVFLYVIKIQL